MDNVKSKLNYQFSTVNYSLPNDSQLSIVFDTAKQSVAVTVNAETLTDAKIVHTLCSQLSYSLLIKAKTMGHL